MPSAVSFAARKFRIDCGKAYAGYVNNTDGPVYADRQTGLVENENHIIVGRIFQKTYRKLLQFVLEANKKEYGLDQYQSLNGLPLVQIVVPSLGSDYTTPPQSPNGIDLSLAPEAYDGAYLRLTNTNNQQVNDDVPLSFYRLDNSFMAQKTFFEDRPLIDYTQSSIIYPSNAIPTAEEGNAIVLVAYYLDTDE